MVLESKVLKIIIGGTMGSISRESMSIGGKHQC